MAMMVMIVSRMSFSRKTVSILKEEENTIRNDAGFIERDRHERRNTGGYY